MLLDVDSIGGSLCSGWVVERGSDLVFLYQTEHECQDSRMHCQTCTHRVTKQKCMIQWYIHMEMEKVPFDSIEITCVQTDP